MSRGPGRVQRRIKALMQSEPTGAWTVEDLCDRVFDGVNRVEKKHRVSLIRAGLFQSRIWLGFGVRARATTIERIHFEISKKKNPTTLFYGYKKNEYYLTTFPLKI